MMLHVLSPCVFVENCKSLPSTISSHLIATTLQLSQRLTKVGVFLKVLTMIRDELLRSTFLYKSHNDLGKTIQTAS